MIIREVKLQARRLPLRQSIAWTAGCEYWLYQRNLLVYFKGRAEPPAILGTHVRYSGYFQKHLWNGCILVVSVILSCIRFSNFVLAQLVLFSKLKKNKKESVAKITEFEINGLNSGYFNWPFRDQIERKSLKNVLLLLLQRDIFWSWTKDFKVNFIIRISIIVDKTWKENLHLSWEPVGFRLN